MPSDGRDSDLRRVLYGILVAITSRKHKSYASRRSLLSEALFHKLDSYLATGRGGNTLRMGATGDAEITSAGS